jgi:hypothetical protein
MAVIPSPLSNSIQGINESTVSGSIFGGNRPDPETKSTLQSLSSSVTSLQSQVNELGKNNITNSKVFANLQESFAAQINSVSLQLNGVNQTLVSIATITASESALERQKDLYEQQQQQKLAEAGARGGKESLLETKIQSALSEPVKRIGNKISFGFDNLMSFIWTLLGGWLTTQIIKGLKALQDGDTKKLNEIKDSVIKTLLVAGGVFTIINVGIVKIISTITGLVGKIGKFIVGGLIIKPFQLVANGLRNTLPGRTPPPATGPKPGPKGPVKGPNFLGGALNLYTALRNLGNGEITDTVMQGVLSALLFTPVGKLVGVVRTVLGVAVTADEIAEVFGSNIFGENPDILKQTKKLKELAEKESQENKKNKLTSSSLKNSEPPKPEAAKPAPTTSMIPPASNLQINAPDTQKPQDTSKPDTQKPATPAPPSPEMIKNFQMAWDNKDIPFARGRIEGAWNKMTPEQKEQAKDWAKSEGHDWTQMKLPDANISKESVKPAPAPSSTLPLMPSAPAETSSKPSTPEITPAQTTKMQTVPFNIGPEPEPKPNIVYAPSGSSTPPQQQPLSTGPASDVPFIPSSNTDNFYTLYSQINYNVVL